MAIIKCPECRREISDKAPLCPGCGVEIADKIQICRNCGEAFFISDGKCNCSENTGNIMPDTSSDAIRQDNNKLKSAEGNNKTKGKRSGINYKTWLFSFIIACIICAGVLAMYNRSVNERETEEYTFALQSNDTLIVKNYLNTFTNAPVNHIDKAKKHLDKLMLREQQWQNVLISKSRQALVDYIDEYPDSKYVAEANNMIDSIDWRKATGENTIIAYETYLTLHEDGEYTDEAMKRIDKLKALIVTPEEEVIIANLFKKFLGAISNRDKETLTSTVADIMPSFIGKQNATKADAILFMEKLYKIDILSISWVPVGEYTIEKNEVGRNAYEYIVDFHSVMDITRINFTKERFARFNISAKVSPDGLITEMVLKKQKISSQ